MIVFHRLFWPLVVHVPTQLQLPYGTLLQSCQVPAQPVWQVLQVALGCGAPEGSLKWPPQRYRIR